MSSLSGDWESFGNGVVQEEPVNGRSLFRRTTPVRLLLAPGRDQGSVYPLLESVLLLHRCLWTMAPTASLCLLGTVIDGRLTTAEVLQSAGMPNLVSISLCQGIAREGQK